MAPLPEPDSAELNDTAPLAAVSLEPLVMRMLPPWTSLDAPASTDTSPPDEATPAALPAVSDNVPPLALTPLADTPADTLTSPPLPCAATPAPIVTAPLLPKVDAPVVRRRTPDDPFNDPPDINDTSPDTPAAPLSAEDTRTPPLELETPTPLDS